MPVFIAITWFETCSFFLLKPVRAAVSGGVCKLNQHEPVLYDGDVCSSIFFLSRCSVVGLHIQLVLTFHIFPVSLWAVSCFVLSRSCLAISKTTSAHCGFITIIL